MTTRTPAWFDRSAVAPAALIEEAEQLETEVRKVALEIAPLLERVERVLMTAEKAATAATDALKDCGDDEGLFTFIMRTLGADQLYNATNALGKAIIDAAEHRPAEGSEAAMKRPTS